MRGGLLGSRIRQNSGVLPLPPNSSRVRLRGTWKYDSLIRSSEERQSRNPTRAAPVPFGELGFNTHVQRSSYPELTKGFLYSVPTVFVLWPMLLLGIKEATKDHEPGSKDASHE